MTDKVRPGADRALHVLAPAKLNLTLDVVGRRADGYHLLESVMQSIDIADVITVAAVASEDDVTARESAHAVVVADGGPGPNGMAVPNGETNLAARAVAALNVAVEADKALSDAAGPPLVPSLSIQIDKRIPVAAGLGGGSADAAAALVAANELWDLQWSRERLADVGLHVGADVPFCLYGGTAIAQGIGERLTPVDGVDPEAWAGVVLNPGYAVSTEQVYRLYSEGGFLTEGAPASGERLERTEAMVDALQSGDPVKAGRLLYNGLEAAVKTVRPEIEALRRQALQAGALGAVMCGSGPSVFALAQDVEHAAVLAARLADAAPYVRVCRFVPQGSRPMEMERCATWAPMQEKD